MVTEAFDLFRAVPDAESRLLSDRAPNEAYLSYVPGEQYLVYFPDGGAVDLNLSEAPGTFTTRWLLVEDGQWQTMEAVSGGTPVRLQPPRGGHWIVLLTRQN